MNKLIELSNRRTIPVYVKEKIIITGSQTVNAKKQKDYEYYKCDYCSAEIKILQKRQEMLGGIVTIPYTVTRRGDIKLALCNKCLKPVLKKFEKEE